MTYKDLQNKNIHFIGIGGIGMSGIASLLAGMGFCVSGSDLSINSNIERIQKKGISVFKGHSSAAIDGKDIIVISSDIKEENPELKEARIRNLPILHRSQMLALLMEPWQGIAISGTHGKTTTTGLMGWVFEKAGLDPTVVNGGVMNAWGSNVKAGNGSWFIAEADESDGSLVNIPRKHAIVTNMDPEHMDYYKSFDCLFSTFETFTTKLDEGGVAFLGIDHPEVYKLYKKIKDKQPCVTFGFHSEADVQAENIVVSDKGTSFDLLYKGECYKTFLTLYGHHNVVNGLAVAATALTCGITPAVIQDAFQSFQGVQRRFTRVGNWQGVTIIDDYAHHPVEIQATLKAARSAWMGRIIAILEPHRYSRLSNHFDEFVTCCDDAHCTIVLPVYAAREVPINGVNHTNLVKGMKGKVYSCDEPEQLPRLIQNIAQSGDMVICLGAGSISSIAHALPEKLSQSNR